MDFGVFLTKTESNEAISFLPRFLALWTNSKKLKNRAAIWLEKYRDADAARSAVATRSPRWCSNGPRKSHHHPRREHTPRPNG